jgi:hypothetical protein
MARFVLIVGLLTQVGITVAQSPLTVATAINDSAKYDGKAASIAALLHIGEHGMFLPGEGCVKRFDTARNEFACAVLVRLPNCPPSRNCPNSLVAFLDTVHERVKASRRPAPIPVILTGRLEVAPKRLVPIPNPPDVPGVPTAAYVQMGFGHMGAFDVQMIVEDARLSSDEELKRLLSPK